MQIRWMLISKIQRAKYNPRVALTKSDREYQQLARSMSQFGNVVPLVVNQPAFTLISGHLRMQILIDRGEKRAKVVVVDLCDEQEKALNLALNKISGRWDQAKLATLLDELAASPELDLGVTGFEMPEIKDLLASVASAHLEDREEHFDVEAAREAQEGIEPITKPGDLIILGADPERQHRLLCGDSTNAEEVRKLMDGQRAVLSATDPPYLISYTGANRPKSRRTKQTKPSQDLPTWDEPGQLDLYDRYLRVAMDEALLSDAAHYIWHASARQPVLAAALATRDILAHQQIIWVKPNAIPGRCWFRYRHEPCLYGWRKGHKPKRFENDEHSTVWEVAPIGRGTSKRPDHPTPKPVLLFEIPMRQHTKSAPSGGELANCYEPFAGSGTQIIAAERLRRRCFAMEMDTKYCDVIVRRFIAYAGEGAVSPQIAEKYRLPATQPARAEVQEAVA